MVLDRKNKFVVVVRIMGVMEVLDYNNMLGKCDRDYEVKEVVRMGIENVW